VSLFAYDTRAKRVEQVVANAGLDLEWAAATTDAIVYEQVGSLHLVDLATRQLRPILVRPQSDLVTVRPHFVDVEPKRIEHFGLSPAGVRAVMETWGEIFTVPTDKGDIRNLTRTPAVAERDPAWSPDGTRIACFSDASGEYALELHDQKGRGQVQRIDLGEAPSFFYSPVWSPDSKKIVNPRPSPSGQARARRPRVSGAEAAGRLEVQAMRSCGSVTVPGWRMARRAASST
jgi:tricorn protease